MLELFRKYSLLAFIVLILLFFGLIFMVDGVGQSGMGTGPKVLTYDGRAYTQSEVETKGAMYGRMFMSILEPGRTTAYMDVIPYMQAMGVSPQGFNPANYLANRLHLKRLTAEYGVTPSQEQIEKFIKETLFTDQNGEFNAATYNDVTGNARKRFGLGIQDFNDLVGEMISVNTLKDVMSQGYSLDPAIDRKAMKVMQQEISYELFSLPIPALRDTITATDEEIKAYWDENKTNYMSEPQLKVQYVISDAKLTEMSVAGKAAADKAAKAEGKSAEEIAALVYTIPEVERVKALNEAGDKIDNLFVSVQDAAGSNFLELSKAAGLEVKTTEFFTVKGAPLDMSLPLYQSQGTVSAALMRLSADAGSMDSVSDVLSVGEGRFLLAQVIEKKAAEPLPYEQVELRAKLDLLDERAKNSLEEEVGKVREKLVASAGTKPVKDTAKELNLLYSKHENMSSSSQIEGDPASGELFMEAITIKDNEFGEPLIQLERGLNRAVFIRPLGRKYITSEENKAALETQLERSGDNLGNAAFQNWFMQQRALVPIEIVEN